MRHQTIVGDGADDAFNLGRKQFFFRLVIELRIGVLNRNDSDQTFQQIVARYRRIFFFKEIILFGVLVDGASQGRAEAGLVGATVGVVDGVSIGQELGVVTVIVLKDHVRD